MLAVDKFLNLNIQKPDIIFINSDSNGSDIMYIPESGNITNFFSSQKLNNLARTEYIVVPPRMVISGKTFINNTYYLSIRKNLKGFPFFKVPTKLKSKNRLRFYDTSPLIGNIVNISNQKTVSQVYREAFEKLFIGFAEFKNTLPPSQIDRKRYVIVDLDLTSPRTGFTANLEYFLKLNNYNIELNIKPEQYPDNIIYKIDNNYYPIATKIIVKSKEAMNKETDLNKEISLSNPGANIANIQNETKDKAYLKISKVMFQRVLNIYEDLLDKPDFSVIKDKAKEEKVKLLGFSGAKDLNTILNIGVDIENILYNKKIENDPVELAKKAKEFIEGNPSLHDLQGKNFKEKLQNLLLSVKHAEKLQSNQSLKSQVGLKNSTTDGITYEPLTKEMENEVKIQDKNVTKLIDEMSVAEQELLKRYNGTLFLKNMQERTNFGIRSFNPDNIVGLKEFNGYDKQAQEFYNNLDENITDLVNSLTKDSDINIKIHKIESILKDDNKTRYKEFNVQISHPNFGQTFSGKYTIRFKIPFPVEGKYLKIGGNDYVMVNQLFNKPVQKVNAHLARLYTHYNTTSVTLKNSKLNGSYGLANIEKETVVGLKNLASNTKLKYSLDIKNISDTVKDELVDFLEPRIVETFQYEQINFKTKDSKFNLDLNNIKLDKPFYTYNTRSILTESDSPTPNVGFTTHESAYLQKETKEIIYNVGGDTRTFPYEHLDEFLLGLYNKLSTAILKTDIIKKSKTSIPFFSAKIIGKNIPVAVLLVTEEGFAKGMARMKLKWIINDKKALESTEQETSSGNSGSSANSANSANLSGLGGDPINIQCMKNGKRVYISVFPKSLKQRCLALGLTRYKVKEVEFSENANDLYYAAMAKDFGEVGLFKLKEALPKIIDPTTEKILREMGYPTDILDLYSDTMPNLLLDRGKSHFEDLSYYRIRLSEAISHVGYKLIQASMSELKRKKNFKDEKIFLKPDFIMSQLLAGGIFQNAKTINPIEEVMLSQKIIKTGIGNVTKSQVTLARRDLNPSYFGVISPTATNEYGGIGSNQTLTNGTTITDRFGSIKTRAYDNTGNPFNLVSPVESVKPFYEYDDTTRSIMGNQQTGQFTQLENPDESLVQTGFEGYFPWLVSDRFSKKAKINGKIQIANDILTINGTGPDIGKIQKIPLRSSKSRTKRGVYLLNKYKLLVNEGQQVKPNTILAATSSLASGKLAMGKNIVIAEMGYNGLNYEDGWVITDAVKGKYKNTYLQKLIMLVPEDVKIQFLNMEKNQFTKTGDKLFSFIKKDYYHEGIDDDSNSEDTDDTLYGLEQHGGSSTYYSPGGRINEIVVRLNSNKVDPKLKTLWNQSVKDLVALQKECTFISDKQAKEMNLTKQQQEEIYMDCMGNTDNISSLQVGGHKINGEEPGWAIVEVYIERDNPINNGSKFTLGNSGGKGTVQYVIPKGQEPESAETHLKIDFIPTSLSIVKRKNPSIYFNMYLGKCFYFINEIAKGLDHKKLKEFVLGAYKIVDKTEDKKILKEMEEFFKQPELTIKKGLNQSNSLNKPLFPMIQPLFQNRITMRDIVELARYIGIPLKEKILIPENDGSYTLKKVPVGILNVFLLEHFPHTQGSVRGSHYVKNSIVTNQGSSGTKDRRGATKTGLYDLYSLLTKTPYNLIKEFHSLKSDAKSAKYAYQRQMLLKNELPSISDIKISKDDTPTKNYIESLLLGAGLKAFY